MTYYCGPRRFSEYVCIEHQNYAGKKARDWWRLRSEPGSPLPVKTSEALEVAPTQVKAATSVRVWVNKKYPEIMSYCFDGTHFNTEEPSEAPTTTGNDVNTSTMLKSFGPPPEALDFDDDIAF